MDGWRDGRHDDRCDDKRGGERIMLTDERCCLENHVDCGLRCLANQRRFASHAIWRAVLSDEPWGDLPQENDTFLWLFCFLDRKAGEAIRKCKT